MLLWILTRAKFHFNQLMLTLIFGVWASEPPPPPLEPGERLKRPGLIGLNIRNCCYSHRHTGLLSQQTKVDCWPSKGMGELPSPAAGGNCHTTDKPLRLRSRWQVSADERPFTLIQELSSWKQGRQYLRELVAFFFHFKGLLPREQVKHRGKKKCCLFLPEFFLIKNPNLVEIKRL